MKELLDIVVLGRACRNTANIKNRQPVAKLYVRTDRTLSEFYQKIMEDELNVKEVIFTDDVREFTSYRFKPQLRTLGRRFGSRINDLKEVLAGLPGNETMDTLNEKGEITVCLEGVDEVLTKEDLLVESAQMEGFVSETDHGITVVLDTKLTKELIEEGFVREIISKIQTMRKENDFEVMDHIRLYQDANQKIHDIIMRNAEQIKSEVLADRIFLGEMRGHTATWNINGESVMFGVTKVSI